MPLIFRHGPTGAAFTAAMAAWLVFEVVMRARQRRQSSGPASADPTYFVLVFCLVAAVIAAEILGRDGRLAWPGGLAWPAVTGIALITAGIGLRAWSITTLGRFFQYQITIQPSHQVVTTGPYRYLRHPAYTACGEGQQNHPAGPAPADRPPRKALLTGHPRTLPVSPALPD